MKENRRELTYVCWGSVSIQRDLTHAT